MKFRHRHCVWVWLLIVLSIVPWCSEVDCSYVVGVFLGGRSGDIRIITASRCSVTRRGALLLILLITARANVMSVVNHRPLSANHPHNLGEVEIKQRESRLCSIRHNFGPDPRRSKLLSETKTELIGHHYPRVSARWTAHCCTMNFL